MMTVRSRQTVAPRDQDLYRCVQCGLCLSVCPTYLETGLETESPRGRIALMKAVREERVGFTGHVVAHMETCLQCRACEVACPSGVPFGRLMETTRAQIRDAGKGSLLRRFFLWLAFRHLLRHPGRLYLLGRILCLYQRTSLGWLLRRMPGPAGQLQELLPSLPSRFFQPKAAPYEAAREGKARIGLLSGCVMPLAHAPTMEAAVRVLTRNGCQVVVPPAQACCGALNLHGGDREQARRMARRNIDAFLDSDIEALVVASAGCGSTMKEYGALLEDDPAYAEKAQRLGGMVVDITEYLADLPLEPPTSPVPLRVTYQDPCHLAHAQRITEAPRRVLRSIPGLELVEMESPERCCGAAGLYSTLQRRMSRRLLVGKVAAVVDTGAEVVVTANPGCIIQLESGLRRAGVEMRVCHVIDLLDQAYRSGNQVSAVQPQGPYPPNSKSTKGT